MGDLVKLSNFIDRMLKKQKQKIVDKHEKQARKKFLEEYFYDVYENRFSIYKINFFRGIFFGLGNVIGGTIVVALLLALLALLAHIFPEFDGLFDMISSMIKTPESADL